MDRKLGYIQKFGWNFILLCICRCIHSDCGIYGWRLRSVVAEKFLNFINFQITWEKKDKTIQNTIEELNRVLLCHYLIHIWAIKFKNLMMQVEETHQAQRTWKTNKKNSMDIIIHIKHFHMQKQWYNDQHFN